MQRLASSLAHRCPLYKFSHLWMCCCSLRTLHNIFTTKILKCYRRNTDFSKLWPLPGTRVIEYHSTFLRRTSGSEISPSRFRAGR